MGFDRPELEVAETSGGGKDSSPLSMGGQLQPSGSSHRRRGPLVVIGDGVVLEGSQMNKLGISYRKDARLAGLSHWSCCDLVSSTTLVQMSIFDSRSSTVISDHHFYGAFGRSISHSSDRLLF